MTAARLLPWPPATPPQPSGAALGVQQRQRGVALPGRRGLGARAAWAPGLREPGSGGPSPAVMCSSDAV